MTMSDTSDGDIIRRLFPRIDALALGAAVGLVAGGALFLFTAAHVLLDVRGPIGLMRQYLPGYGRSWPGAGAGLAWGLVIGFASGWLMAAVHNVTVHAWVAVVRARANLSRSRRFLDQVR
jgi:hypothetical protein